MKRIILCADDYGQNKAISQGILDLLEKNRLSATSCLVNTKIWSTFSQNLKPYQDKIDIGLHLNLTEGLSLSQEMPAYYRLPELIARSHLRLIKKANVVAEFNAQIDVFIKAMGFAPRFVDGHQHVHQLPVVRDALLNVYEKRLHTHGTYIRSTAIPFASNHLNKLSRTLVKQYLIQLTGGKSLHNTMEELGIPHNSSFGGIYDFARSNTYATLFPGFLKDVKNKGLILCHPGLSESENDPIANARANEYAYFSSDQFLKDLTDAGVELGRF